MTKHTLGQYLANKTAFPLMPSHTSPEHLDSRFHGLSTRDLFAAIAMQGFITSTFTNTGGQCVGFTGYDGKMEDASPEVIARQSVIYADALIAELAKAEGLKS